MPRASCVAAASLALATPCIVVKRMYLSSLETGNAFYFPNWPTTAIPLVAAGVYTLWNGDQFIDVGMAG